jgi:hypothetical protein
MPPPVFSSRLDRARPRGRATPEMRAHPILQLSDLLEPARQKGPGKKHLGGGKSVSSLVEKNFGTLNRRAPSNSVQLGTLSLNLPATEESAQPDHPLQAVVSAALSARDHD